MKLLAAELTNDPLRVSRFEQEARAASALSHSHVCVIHALGTTGDGRHYIAMEYVEGETLRAHIRPIEILKVVAQWNCAYQGHSRPWFPLIYGGAYLMLHDGKRAAEEFQKFLDHRGLVVNCLWGALARLGLARVGAAFARSAARS